MQIEEQFDVAIPIARAWKEISNIGEIGYCIAGVKNVTVINDSESKWKIEARAGFMSREFDLDGRITSREPPRHFAFSGTGQDVTLSGAIKLHELGPSSTRVEATIDAQVTGPFATIVDLMARGPQQQLIRKTIANVRERLDTLAEEGTGQANTAGARPAPTVAMSAPPLTGPTGRRGRKRQLQEILERLRRIEASLQRLESAVQEPKP